MHKNLLRTATPLVVNELTQVKSYKYDYDEVIFIWGSMFCNDWQHLVIDFLPLFDTALELIVSKPNVPIVVGPNIKFFEHFFPFNVSSRYIPRNKGWPTSGNSFTRILHISSLIYYFYVLYLTTINLLCQADYSFLN